MADEWVHKFVLATEILGKSVPRGFERDEVYYYAYVVRRVDENTTFPYVLDSPTHGWTPCVAETQILREIPKDSQAYALMRQWHDAYCVHLQAMGDRDEAQAALRQREYAVDEAAKELDKTYRAVNSKLKALAERDGVFKPLF